MKIISPYHVAFLIIFTFISDISCQTNEIENKFNMAGLIDIHTIDNSIKVDPVNSDPDKNYFRENFYNGLNKAYVRKEVAEQLASAQKYLKDNFPAYSLLIKLISAFSFDAHHNRSLRMQLKVVWYLLLIDDTERPTLITGTAWLTNPHGFAFLAH